MTNGKALGGEKLQEIIRRIVKVGQPEGKEVYYARKVPSPGSERMAE
jgi:hypothetical protein